MLTTTNLGLTVWNNPSDTWNSAQLAANWLAIDADYNRTRPTDRAEVLATLPGSGNFNGRLVYLSAANGGFTAGTLVRYQGAAWGAVGPQEVQSSVPATGNYAGRLVLLSAASSGFEAWTLIRYDGATWAPANRSFELSATVPVTGNFAGRVVMLTGADSGFLAYDLIRYSGSAWAKIGPAAIPPATELAYHSRTTDLTTTNAVSPGDTITTFSAATFENVKYYLEIDIPIIFHTVAAGQVNFLLREGAATVGTIMSYFNSPTAAAKQQARFRMPFTPTAASHTYLVTWYITTAGTATIQTTGSNPATFRIIKG